MRNNVAATLSCALVLGFITTAHADDLTFGKTKYSSVKMPKEADVVLTVRDSGLSIKGKNVNGIDIAIPYSSIHALTYELAERHRVGEGAAVMLFSLGAGAIIMGTKTKSHWLDVEYSEGNEKQVIILRLDKSEYKAVLSAVEARSGMHIPEMKSKDSPMNPTAESRDMDEVIPFHPDAIAAALKPAMESFGCNIKKETADRVECMREWSKSGGSERNGVGHEEVVATFEAKGDQTHVKIETDKGFRGRMGKKNWSTPIYQQLMQNLQKSGSSAPAAPPASPAAPK